MRFLLLLLFPALGLAQSTALLRLDPINLMAPAVNNSASVAVFAAALDPDGTPRKGTDLYLYDGRLRRLTNYSGDLPFTGVTGVTWGAGFAGFTAQPGGPDGLEEVHLYNVATNVDRTLVSERFTCAQILCVDCRRSCLGPVHVAADGASVLYSVAQNQPFRVVSADGSARKPLPVYAGAIAPSPQRVISRGGQLVFTSSAPSGPTFAAAAADVHVIQLDGTGLRQVTHFGKAEFFALNATSSADGAVIVFESNYPDADLRGQNKVWMVRSDGSELRRLSTGSEPASSPSISADGSIVVFLQGGQIKRVKTSGDASILTLTNLAVSAAREPVVADDGSQVVFTLGPATGTAAAVYRIPSDSLSETRFFDKIYAPRFVNSNGVVSVTGFGPPSPGSLISVYGVNLGTNELDRAGSFPLPESLNGVSLTVNGRSVPLVAVTPWQINAQLPQSTSPGTAEFRVPSLAPVTAEIKAEAPTVLAFPWSWGKVGYEQAAVFHAGTGVLADAYSPAAVGETVEIYGSGLGLTDPVVAAGLPSPGSPPARALKVPRVRIGSREAVVQFAGLTPGLAGVYQVNAVIPAGTEAGFHSIEWIGPDGTLHQGSIAVK